MDFTTDYMVIAEQQFHIKPPRHQNQSQPTWEGGRIQTDYSLRLLLCGGSAKEVKLNLEPLVNVGVDGVVLVADLLWCQALLSGLVLCGRAVLVRATHIQQVPASHAAVPGGQKKKNRNRWERAVHKRRRGYKYRETNAKTSTDDINVKREDNDRNNRPTTLTWRRRRHWGHSQWCYPGVGRCWRTAGHWWPGHYACPFLASCDDRQKNEKKNRPQMWLLTTTQNIVPSAGCWIWNIFVSYLT